MAEETPKGPTLKGWFPGWYVTRLHYGPAQGKALCGAHTEPPRSEWQKRKLVKDVPQCRLCLRKLWLQSLSNDQT